ncbi:MAG TPA: VWA domain-containing protein [Terriglobia bacterium]|jgi:Ca-activated chloride channel family protein
MNARKHVWIGSIVILCVLCAGAVHITAQTSQQPAAQETTAQETPAPATPPADVQDPQDPRYRLNINVELVNVTATVLDDQGKYLDGLKVDDFQIFENGEKQKISFFSHDLRVPVSVGVLIDSSGSMRHKLQQALQTVREVALALSPQDEMFVVQFSSDVQMRQHFTSNMQDVQKSLRDIRAGGETAAYDAIQTGMEEMKKAKHNKKILLMVTDGFDTKSHINSTQVEDILKRSEVLVYAIGIDDDDDDPLALGRTRYHIYHYMLGRLTSISGGRAFRLFTGRNYALNGLAEVLLEELHQQYTLGYYPTTLSDKNTWREVDVKVSKPGSQIRHRTGYYVTEAKAAKNLN